MNDRDDDLVRGGDDRDPEAEAAALEQEIAVTRGQMAETVQAIGERLSPTNLVAGAKESVREATIGRVEDVADAAGEMIGGSVRGAQDVGTGLLDTIRSNPIPAAMTAIGIAWLWRSRTANGHRTAWNGGNGRAWDVRWRESASYPQYDAQARGWESERARGDSPVSQAGRAAGDAAAQAGDTIGDAAARAGSAVGGLQEGASRAVDDMARQAATTTRQAQGQVERLFDDSPLVVGAAAIGFGALAASLIPNTEFEERLYGQPRDQLIGQVEHAAQGALDQVSNQLQETRASAGSSSNAGSTGSTSGATGSTGSNAGSNAESSGSGSAGRSSTAGSDTGTAGATSA